MSNIDHSALPARGENSESDGVGSGARFVLPKAIFTVSLVVFVLISVLKSLRLPNLWATTQLTFNYSHGFVRRGLLGELIRQAGLGPPYRYNILAAIGMVAFVPCAVGTALLIRKALGTAENRGRYQLEVLVTVASPAVVFIVHLAGYLDNFGMAAMLVFVLLYLRDRQRSPYLGFLIVSALSILLAVIHENLIVLFGPVMIFTVVCVGIRRLDNQGGGLRSRIVFSLCTIATGAFCIGASLLIARWGTRSQGEIDALRQAITEASDFVPRKDAFIPLFLPLRENFYSVMPSIYNQPQYWWDFFFATAAVLPALAFLLYSGWNTISCIRLVPAFRFFLLILFVGVSLSPLSLHLVGWDVSRWNALAIICAFFALSIIRIVFGDRLETASFMPAKRSSYFIGFTIAVISLELAGGIQLFDNEKVRMYPYDSLIEFIIHWVQNGFSYIPNH